MQVGYKLMTEGFSPTQIVAQTRLAEQAGFDFVEMSDHYHPWLDSQGHSGFTWSMLGAMAASTDRIGLVTGVTCPFFRYHPAIIAQAAATLEAMYPGRFWLGLGAGEALNEHITGEYWPEAPTRLERLAESIEVIQKLLNGKVTKYSGKHIRLESAKLYTLPPTPPPIYVATAGPIQSERTGRTCDGIITVGAGDEKIKNLMDRFEKGAREAGKDPSTMPRLIQLHVSWADTQKEAEQNAINEWPNGGMPFPKGDIRNPEDFEAMAKFVRIENFKNRVLISPDLEEHRAHIQHFIDLGFTEVYVHNVGRNQEAFLEAYGKQVVPQLNWNVAQPVA